MSEDIMEKFAGAALDGVLSKLGDMGLNAILGSEPTIVELSEATFTRIKDIVKDAIKEEKLNELKNSTRTVLDGLADNLSDPTRYPLLPLLEPADEVRNQIAGIQDTGYKAAIPYWVSASAVLCVHQLLYDGAVSTNTSNDPAKGTGGDKGAAPSPPSPEPIARCAFSILADLLTFEGQMRVQEGLDVFSTFKRYTLGEDPYADPSTSPLSYMGKNYRENVQKLLGIIDKYDPNNRNADPTKRLLNQVAYPKYLIKFFDFVNVSDQVMHAWDSRDGGGPDDRRWAVKFWMCFPIGDYHPIGDLCIADDAYAGRDYTDRLPKRVPYIRAVGEGRLAYLADYQLKWKDKDSHNPVDLSCWYPVPPDGFAPIASVINQTKESKPSGDRCVVAPLDDVDLIEPGDRTWNSGTFDTEDGSTWRHPEGSFGDAGLFVMGSTLDNKPTETPLAKFKQSALGGHPALGIVPAAPNFDSGNWTGTAGAFGTSGRWNKGYKVRYRIGFYSPTYGTIVGPWWHPTYGNRADADGYYDGAPWACPTITNISTDPTGTVVARIVYRQFFGLPSEVVGVIANNQDTRFLDQVDVPTYGPPPTAPTFDPANWTNSVPVAGSSNWQPGYKVRYAVSFYNSEGETPMGPWWSPTFWPGMDFEGFFQGGTWAWPALVEIPVDPTNTATGRKIYRQFRKGLYNYDIELVHDLKDNQTTTYSDTNP